jgi:hypothetical protein
MAATYHIPRGRENDLLYYETGFEQMHPWMEELGYTYGKDWHCYRRVEVVEDTGSGSPAVIQASGRTVETGYCLEFPTEELLALFLLRWGEGAYRPTKHNW